MAPGAPGKRKRGDRTGSGDSVNESQRPSPHRPGSLHMAQHPNAPQSRDSPESRGRLRRQSSRGGRGSNTTSRRSSGDSQNIGGGRKETPMSPPNNATSARSEPEQTNGTAFQHQVSMTTTAPSPAPSTAPSAAPSALQPPSQSAAPSQPPMSPAQTPAVSPLPYDYEYVTDSAVEDWAASGRQNVVEQGVQARSAEDDATLAAIYQELIRAALNGRLSPTDAGGAVKDILGEEVATDDVDMVGQENVTSVLDSRSLFLDTLSILTDSDNTHAALKPLVFATGISPALMRAQLETPLLQSLGLVRDTFNRMGIRKQTNLLYRQSNYNLLREESEGYSKLLTELFTTSNNEPPSSEVVEDTFEKVKAMIGAFDMDVGRVLDVTLDVFAAVLVKQYRFFVKLLRASSWWPKDGISRLEDGDFHDSGLPNWALPGSSGWLTTDEERTKSMHTNVERDQAFWNRVREIGIRAFFEIGRKPVSKDELNKILPETNSLSEEEIGVRKWIEETGTLPPRGNRVAAQLLGFKLRFYSSRARAKSDILPDNLIYLAALLIKVGFISLRDLYPHLWRPDDAMDALKEEKLKEKAERERAARPGGGVNALMMAGALSDDTIPTPRMRESEARSVTPGKEQDADKAKTEENELPEPSDQKVSLLKSLLAIGAIPESLFILSKFPWLMDTYPELPEFIHRIVHHCLDKVYVSLRPLASTEDIKEQQQVLSPDQTGVPKGQVRLIQAPPRRVLRWAQLDKDDTNDGTDYRFYWDDWADNIPICQSVDDVFTLCSSFLNISGHKIGQDPSLLVKLVRIGKDSLNKDNSQENRDRWRDLLKRLLLPSVSLTKENPGVVNEVFDLLSFFPRETRYNMYAEWYSGQTSRLPDVKSAFDQARAEAKDVLKRLSKTNIKPMARALAKIAYANPGVVINVAISQIESYENLIEVVVECARYFTDLGYDVLTWALISSLGQKGRSRVQEGGLLTSRWLNALATFAGRTFRRYSIMDPTPLLQYVVEQLRQNNSTDLIVLEQLIGSMGGIVADSNFNDNQLQAMAGGEILQAQTILQLLDKRHESKNSSKRLMKSLTASKLAGQLLIAISQERWTCIFKESDGSDELKLLGNVFDEIHRVLSQYLDLLRSNLPVDEFDSFVPDFASLIGEFGVQPEIAFWIRRPSIAQRIIDVEKATQEETAAAAKPQDTEGETAQAETDKMETNDEETTGAEGAPSADNSMDVDKEAAEKPTDSDPVGTVEQAAAAGPSEPPPLNSVLQELQDQVKSVMPQDSYAVVGLRFYVIFWQLSVYDVHIPQKAYEDEIERQKKKVISITRDVNLGTQKKDAAKKQITQLQDQILEENKAHLKSYGQTRTKLQKEKDQWFAGMRGKHDSLNVSLLEQCFIPRLLLSPIDAFYCFKMLKFLHSSGTPNFRTVGLLDQLFREQRITALVFQCTSREADNFGRFLNEILRDLTRWHADKAVYEKEAFGTKKDLPGFAMSVDPEGKPTQFLEYEDFRRLLYKWHRLLSSALKICLNGGEYMHIRNAISVLKAIVQHFPAVNWIGRDMLTSVNNLSQTDERDDVKIPAASLIGDLNRRERQWMLPQAFMITNQPAPAKTNKSVTPRPQSTTPAPMNANAAEFKPSANESHDTQRPEAATKEVEDGEIEDAKMTDAKTKDASQNEQAEKSAEHADTAPGKDGTTTANEASAGEGQSTAAKEPEAKPTQTSENRTEGEAAQPSSQPDSGATTKAPGQTGRPGNIPRRPDTERPLPHHHPRSQVQTPTRPHREETRLPPRPDLVDDRRDRYPEYPRGGRFGDPEYNRPPFDQPMGDGRNYGRLERDYPMRPMEEPFRGPPREGRLPREPDWQDRTGRGPPGGRTGPPTHPDRAGMIDHHERPGYGFRRGDLQRQEKDDLKSSPSRAKSPPRPELANRPERFPADDRRQSGYQPHPRHQDLPTGPRNDRVARAAMDAPDAREPSPGADLSQGRLRHQMPPSEIPSGPRGRNLPGRGGRSASGMSHPGPGSSGSGPGPMGPSERQPPSGPGRQGMRGSPEHQPPSGPPSPSGDKLEATGMHPDRLKALQQQEASYGGGGAGMRPQQPPSQASSTVPPSGPRSALGPPPGPPMSRMHPAAPGFGGERGRGDKRTLGSINNILQQSSGPADRGPGPAIRGRGASRQMNTMGGPTPQSSQPPTPGDEDGSRSGSFGQSRPDLLDDSAPRSRPSTGRGGGDLLDDSGPDSRRSSRYTHDRERERERERRGAEDDGTPRSSRREEHRDRNREYDRERSRRSDATTVGTREERYESREVSRRSAGSRDENRRRRDRDDGADAGPASSQEYEGRLRPPSSLGGQPPPPPPPPLPGNAEDDRRWGGGRDRDRERSTRDRGRERDYHRESTGSSGPHRKRGRPGDEGGPGEGAGRGGVRLGSESKRPRRGA